MLRIGWKQGMGIAHPVPRPVRLCVRQDSDYSKAI
jgi:hypothetical protein